MTHESMTLSRKAVRQHLRGTRTTWPEVKAWTASKSPRIEMSVSEVVGESGVDVALWACRTLPRESEGLARRLAAAFAYGPEGEIIAAYERRTKGCTVARSGFETLLAWIEGGVTDGAAAEARWSVAKHSLVMRQPGAHHVLQAISAGFAPCAWGGCGVAHEYALAAHPLLGGRMLDDDGNALSSADARNAATTRAVAYHAFLIGELMG